MAKIAASMLAADVMHMSREVHSLEDAACDLFHIDVMDGVFVPNISYGPLLVSSMKKKTPLPLDVHLMIVCPERYIDRFIEAGADFLTVHFEAVVDLRRTLKEIRDAGVTAGVSIKPGTSVSVLEPYFDDIDMVLIMTVEPGFGGQKYMPDMLKKVKALRQMGYEGLIEVDGGISDKNLPDLVEAGIDIAVMGTSLFAAKDKHLFIEKIHQMG